jgi:chemotaxis protein MotB
MTSSRRAVVGRSPSLRASGDRWLFGYADIVTLLFACFASLYAVSAQQVAAAPVPVPVVSLVAAPAPEPPPAPVTTIERDLANLTSPEADRPAIEIAASARGVIISLPETGSFAAGRADLTPAALLIIRQIADVVGPLPNVIRVEGHTDDVPIHTPLYASNWELSTARATRVVQWLIEAGGVPADRLSAAGYAEYHPRVANDSVANRARNRRVDIVVVDPTANPDAGARE